MKLLKETFRCGSFVDVATQQKHNQFVCGFTDMASQWRKGLLKQRRFEISQQTLGLAKDEALKDHHSTTVNESILYFSLFILYRTEECTVRRKICEIVWC